MPRIPRLISVLLLALMIVGQHGLAPAADKPLIPPEAVPVFNKAVAFLNSRGDKLTGGKLSLAALALRKAGQPDTNPIIVKAIASVESCFKPGSDGNLTYTPHTSSEGVYEAGVDIMLLLAVSEERYVSQVEAAAQYLMSVQLPDGSWTYPGQQVGDTSMSQYALLGFWSAKIAGVEIPMDVWNRAAQWHIRTQNSDGGFAYHPGTTDGLERGASTHNLTNAGIGSLYITRMFLYPETEKKESKAPKKFGILEAADPAASQSDAKTQRAEVGDVVPLTAIEGSIRRALGWANSRFVLDQPNPHKNYYYYTVERVAAFANLTQIGGRDWYSSCLGALKQKQAQDGSWTEHSGPENGTSFAILFMVKSTGKLLARPDVGGGLLAGGRGLPDKLGEANVTGGEVKGKRKITDPLDQLLTDLASQDISVLEGAQQAIVEKVQIGDRNELLKQMDRVRKLADHPNVEVRRTAVWALGRSRNLRDAGLLIKALQDPDADVVVEANNALSYLSRKLNGVGVTQSPYDDLPEGASDEQKADAMHRWRTEALAGWSTWYLRVRPYEDRNDAFELQLRNAVNRK